MAGMVENRSFVTSCRDVTFAPLLILRAGWALKSAYTNRIQTERSWCWISSMANIQNCYTMKFITTCHKNWPSFESSQLSAWFP